MSHPDGSAAAGPAPPVALVTGASDGIGAEAAVQLAALGWRLVLTGRSPAKLDAVVRRCGDAVVLASPVDFAVLDDVRTFARAAAGVPLVAVAHNAGGLFAGRQKTADGFERTLQVDHLAGVLLQHELGFTGRTVFTSSLAHHVGVLTTRDPIGQRNPLGGWAAYGRAKLLNVLSAKALAARGVDAVSWHPAVVATSFPRQTVLTRAVYTLTRSTLVTPAAAGAVLAWLLSVPSLEVGAFYDGTVPTTPSRRARDDRLAEAAWQRSCEVLGLPRG